MFVLTELVIFKGTYFDWVSDAPRDPATNPTYTCVRMSLSEDYTWQDFPCSARNAYICQHGIY